MERKKFSKFFSFISNFLKVSFLSAIVALGFSYNSFVRSLSIDNATPTNTAEYNIDGNDIGSYYDTTGYQYAILNKIVYAIDTTKNEATAIHYDGNATPDTVTIPDKFSYTPNGGSAIEVTVKEVIPNLLNKIPANGELILPDGDVKLIKANAGAPIPDDGNGKVYVSVADKTTSPHSSFNDWAKGINAKEAKVTVKEGDSVSYMAGDTLETVKDKLIFNPAENSGKGTWKVTVGSDPLDDKATIPSGTQTLSFSFEATAGADGKYEYKDTTKPIPITLEEEKGSEAQTPSVSKSKIVYTAKKTTWKELINEAGVTPSEKEAQGHWIITKKDGSELYYDPTSNEAGKDGSKAIESGISEVVFNYVPKSSADSYKKTSITVTLVEGISCKDFNIKANISGNNPTLENVDLPKVDANGTGDTKVVDGNGKMVSGTWEWSDKSKSVAKFENTDCEAVFTPTDTAKYPTITKNFKVYNLGKEQTFGDHTFSVSGDGVTSGTVSGKGITWIRESSGGTAAWYGFDNSDGILPDGATVAVRWIGAKENPEEYAKYVEEAQKSGKPFEDNKLWVFEVRAFDSDMNEIKDFGKDEGGNPKKIKFYIESGDDWDADDVIAFFVDTEGGNPEFWDVSQETKTINGEEKEFIVAKLSHLSVHFVGDEKKAGDILKDLQKAASNAETKYKLEHPNASLQDLQEVRFEAMQKAYEQLSDDDKKLFADYAEFLRKSESEDSGSSSDSKVTPQSDSSSSGSSSSSTPKSSTYSTSSSPSTTTSSSKIKTGSDISNLLFLMQYVFGTSLGTAIISRKKKFD